MPSIRFGTIRAYDAGTNTASVEVTGYQASLLEGVPVALDVDAALLVDGARCLVVLNDGFDTSDTVVACVY